MRGAKCSAFVGEAVGVCQPCTACWPEPLLWPLCVSGLSACSKTAVGVVDTAPVTTVRGLVRAWQHTHACMQHMAGWTSTCCECICCQGSRLLQVAHHIPGVWCVGGWVCWLVWLQPAAPCRRLVLCVFSTVIILCICMERHSFYRASTA